MNSDLSPEKIPPPDASFFLAPGCFLSSPRTRLVFERLETVTPVVHGEQEGHDLADLFFHPPEQLILIKHAQLHQDLTETLPGLLLAFVGLIENLL